MTKDLIHGDPALLPLLLQALASFEHVIAADPGASAPTRAAWAAVQQAAASYAQTCPDLRPDYANPATLTEEIGTRKEKIGATRGPHEPLE